MSNSADRANVFASHAGNIARCVHGDGVEVADKAGTLRAYGDAGPAMDAGIPADLKDEGRFVIHAKVLVTAQFIWRVSLIAAQ